jgi:methylmalonyl-CoA mutase N-terminal domain/subunit
MADMKDAEEDRGGRRSAREASSAGPASSPVGADMERKPCYRPEDVAPDLRAHHEREIGEPGRFPFTRGIHETMYRERLWTMRQYAGYQSAEESNKRYRYLLERGQTGLSVAFDLPTQVGYDSDAPLARGEVGRVGVPISCLADIEALFEGIPLEDVSVSMTINTTAIILLAFVVALAKRRGVPLEKLRGTTQNDILKEYVARGTYRFPPAPSLRLVTDTIAFAAKELPKWNPISISGYHIREAGSTAVQELAFTFADGIAYVEAAVARGLAVDDFAPQLSFFFNAHNDFLEEVAKFRAARRIWARIMRERFHAKKDRSLMLRFHAQTAGSTLTSQQYDNNVARVTIQALAAVLGGCQSLHTNSRDEALALPTEQSVKIALRTQQIIAHESGVAASVDPLGGSYLVEALTDEIERRVVRYLERIDALGGTLRAIEQGFLQQEIHDAAFAFQRRLEKGEAVQVGVNRFAEEAEAARAPLLRIDPSVEEARRAALADLRRRRDAARARAALLALEAAARDPAQNLVPHVVRAVESDVTLGEICTKFCEVFGEFEESEHY